MKILRGEAKPSDIELREGQVTILGDRIWFINEGKFRELHKDGTIRVKTDKWEDLGRIDPEHFE